MSRDHLSGTGGSGEPTAGRPGTVAAAARPTTAGLAGRPAGRHRCGIVPPYLLAALAMGDDPYLAARAVRTLERDTEVRRERLSPRSSARPVGPPAGGTRAGGSAAAPGSASGPRRTVADAHHEQTLPGATVRSEGAAATDDVAVTEAYDGLGSTWTFYAEAYHRNSLDDKGLPLLATVHYSEEYDNAYWDGERMVFGDGDGKIFGRFTASVDVIGHELTHGVTDFTAGLRYQGQSGALNESISDVFGILVKQKLLGQNADRADWLIGADLLLPDVHGVALRSMKAPGTAYDDPQLGKDPQPAHMDDYLTTASDNGGVHTNSGIPNRAFYLAATAIGGRAWEAPGQIWYSVLSGGPIKADCDFATFAGLTVDAAGQLFGSDSAQQRAVRSAWEQVGVTRAAAGKKAPVPAAPAKRGRSGSAAIGSPSDAVGSPPDPAGAAAPDSAAGPPLEAVHTVTVRRSGGFAGRTLERTVRLGDLPAQVAEQWTALLAGGPPPASGGRTHPDAFVYQLEAGPLAVTLSEHDLPADLRGLFRSTLEDG